MGVAVHHVRGAVGGVGGLGGCRSRRAPHDRREGHDRTHGCRLTRSGTGAQSAAEHLWMHFTRMGNFANSPVPIVERGEGAYIYDNHGKRYLDALSGLFVVQAGYGRDDSPTPLTGRPVSWRIFRFGHMPPRRPSIWPTGSRAGSR